MPLRDEVIEATFFYQENQYVGHGLRCLFTSLDAARRDLVYLEEHGYDVLSMRVVLGKKEIEEVKALDCYWEVTGDG